MASVYFILVDRLLKQSVEEVEAPDRYMHKIYLNLKFCCCDYIICLPQGCLEYRVGNLLVQINIKEDRQCIQVKYKN